MGKIRVKSIEEPVFVSEEKARTYNEDHAREEFVSGGWYVQAEVQYVESRIEGQDVGAEALRYFGPYETEQEALGDIPRLAPGVLVRLS